MTLAVTSLSIFWRMIRRFPEGSSPPAGTASGTYPEASVLELHGAGDDRLDVWIDEKLVIRRTPPADMHTQVERVQLEAGIHAIRVDYVQHGGAYNLRVEWAPAAGETSPPPRLPCCFPNARMRANSNSRDRRPCFAVSFQSFGCFHWGLPWSSWRDRSLRESLRDPPTTGTAPVGPTLPSRALLARYR